MPITIDNPNGEGQIDVFTPEEVAAKEAEAQAAKDALAARDAEYKKLESIHASQADNFKRFKDMSEEEISKLSAKDIENIKRIEAAEDAAAAAHAKLTEKEQADADAKKATLVQKYTGGDKDLVAKFEEKFATLAGVADPEERAAAAAILAGIGIVPGVNPITQQFNGAPYVPKEQKESEQFLASDRASAAIAAMGGLPELPKKD